MNDMNSIDRESDQRFSESNVESNTESTPKEDNELKNKSIITFVLDESASMKAVKDTTISGFNEYLETLKNKNVESKFKLILFNSSKKENRYNFEDIQDIQQMGEEDYNPCNLTPLYDSIGRGINETDKYLKTNRLAGNVIFTIMTDGQENSSQKYTRPHIFNKIISRQNRGWNFVYLGSQQDSWVEGQRIGIDRRFTADYAYGRERYAMRYLGRRTSEFEGELRRGIRNNPFFREEDRSVLRGY